MRTRIVALALAPALALIPAAALAAEPTTLTLSASGETRLAPDMATVTLGVTASAPTAVGPCSRTPA